MMNPSIFKAYDIRGVYPTDIDEDAVYKIGRAFVQFLGAKKIAIGRDIRKSSPSLFDALSKGIAEQGADVIDLGLTTTPMLYFASGRLDVDGAISLTASHNPGQYNGVKLCKKNAIPIGENSGLLEIKEMVLNDSIEPSSETGKVTQYDIREDYIDYFSSFAKFGNRQFNVVIDTANAMGILELELYKKFPENFTVDVLYGQFDPEFPNHEANPLKEETLRELQKLTQEKKADLGIAYDGDADRIGFIDEKGAIIPMDLITGLLAKIILKKHPGATILYDLRSSKAVKEMIEENGGIARECRVGHALIKRQMREEDAVFAGELSGHYYFEENYFAEAGSFAAVMLFNLMAETGEPISKLVKEAHRYSHSGEINSEVEDKEAVLARLKEEYKDGAQHELDGLKVEYPDWWFNVRPSNTEPLLRLNLEADTAEMMQKKRDEILKIIRNNTT